MHDALKLLIQNTGKERLIFEEIKCCKPNIQIKIQGVLTPTILYFHL